MHLLWTIVPLLYLSSLVDGKSWEKVRSKKLVCNLSLPPSHCFAEISTFNYIFCIMEVSFVKV